MSWTTASVLPLAALHTDATSTGVQWVGDVECDGLVAEPDSRSLRGSLRHKRLRSAGRRRRPDRGGCLTLK